MAPAVQAPLARRRDYFKVAGTLPRPGELIYVSTAPQPARRDAPGGGEKRLALVMVRGDERGAASVRLVQDFGRADDPIPGAAGAITAAPAAPVKRGRGRPPGSGNRRSA